MGMEVGDRRKGKKGKRGRNEKKQRSEIKSKEMDKKFGKDIQ